MKNISSLSKVLLLVGVQAILTSAALVLLALGFEPLPVPMALLALALVSSGFAVLGLRALRAFLGHVSQVGSAVAAGNFSERLQLRAEYGDVLRAGHAINDMIDVNDAFVRESALAMTAASEGRFYRKIGPEGMRGAFLISVNTINAAIDRLADRPALMRDLQQAFGEVVDAAVAGDFSKRVEAQFPDLELNTLARGINNLVATVDRGLGETGEVLAALADTDLTKRVEGDYQGSFAKLKEDTNAVADKLSEVVVQLRSTSQALKIATEEILTGANDLSERTTKQAATIEETSATMAQLASTVADNARMAEDADEQAQAASQGAAQSGAIMDKATEAMERITASSAKISNIIGMIDDIAFQTNLLALNASVEAARAGDAGKGFAVVAVEVRRLAQSAASASGDVKALIDQSANEVRAGTALVSDASGQLTTMLKSVNANATLMQSIAQASREQAAAIDRVSMAVRAIDEMTQHNAALVEETNAAIEQTEGQASELDQIVGVFRISGQAEPYVLAMERDRDASRAA
ncbi:MAG TPA: methyl-accepting chemotaxis protein [Pelagibacterium sp.]|uniref:methyl-accepting chemotaxis protein n=1 Tax=Pelagibacterium sp. TaxID=1967288 RepID=UPI002B52ADFC|nr:methyl-accepting chemotaxis protein [Pelagibacterium sp.]HWJ88743.1 methyl-accepting chemotaxis protein [Pelagibacterium sp.]